LGRSAQVLQEPQPLLGKAARRLACTGAGLRLGLAGRGLWQPPSGQDRSHQRGHRGRLQEVCETDLGQQHVLDRRQHSHRHQRLASELEEVVADADPLETQDLLPDVRDRRFQQRQVSRRRAGSCPNRILLKFAHARDASSPRPAAPSGVRRSSPPDRIEIRARAILPALGMWRHEGSRLKCTREAMTGNSRGDVANAAVRTLVKDGRFAEAWSLLVPELLRGQSTTPWGLARNVLRAGARRQWSPGAARQIRLALLCTYEAAELSEYLRVACLALGIDAECYVAPYGQLEQELLGDQTPLAQFRPTHVVIAPTVEDLGFP